MMDISDRELRERLISHGFIPPPVTDSSRDILLKKLKKLQSSDTSVTSNIPFKPSVTSNSPLKTFKSSDRELRERLSDYGLNSPPVTDSTRSILAKRLESLDTSGVTLNGKGEPKPSRKSRTSVITRTQDYSPEKYDNHAAHRQTRSSRRGTDELDFGKVMNSTPLFNRSDPFEHGSDSDVSDSSRQISFQAPLLARKPLSIRRDTQFFSSPAFRKYETDNGASSYLNRNMQRNRYSSTRSNSWAKVSKRFSLNKITPTVVLLVFLLFFVLVGFIYYSKNDRVSGELFTDDAVKPLCSQRGKDGVSCVIDGDINSSLLSLKSLYRSLHKAQVDMICGGGGEDAKAVTTIHQDSVVELLIREFDFFRYEADKMIKNLVVLVKTNPQFKIIWSEEEKTFDLQEVDLSWRCEFKRWMYLLAGYTVQLLLTVGLLVSMNYVLQWCRTRHNEHDKGIQELVKGILDIVQQNAISKPNQTFIPIVHVREQLIPYADRERKKKVWACAVKYVEDNESRIRKEVQPVKGEDYDVWRWVGSHQQSPPKPKTWQGEAFETSKDNMNTPSTSPAPCLKIRNMFNPKKESGGEWVTVVKDAILERCEGINIVHISVDQASSDGCVYIKCASTEDAGKAFCKMHGAWFDGQIVSVKYLRLERYHERFPNSVEFSTPLKPSNDLKRSIV